MQYSVLKLSDIKVDNDFFRIDAEFFKKEYVKFKELLLQKDTKTFSELTISIRKGIFDISPDSYRDRGIPFLRVQNIKNGFLDKSDCVFISQEDSAKEYKTALDYGDLAISKVGSVGNICLLMEKANTSQNVISVKTNKDTINPFYLFAFLISEYGQKLIEKTQAVQVQSKLELHEIRKLRIPILKRSFQSNVEDVVEASYFKLEQSRTSYHHAQTILLSELGLLDWQPKHHLSFVKNYSDTQHAGRFDAEYFQPKYEKIVKAIKNYKGGWDTLGNLVTVKKCVEVGSGEYLDEGIPFVRVSNLSPFEVTEEKYISEKLYSEIKQHQPKKGEILFSKDATPGIAYYLQEQPQKMIPSGGILRLKSKTDKINNECLTLVLNSILTKEQVNRDVGGSVILHWRPDQVKGTVIPILPEEKQIQIQQKVSESFNLRKQSKHLLECAKKAVEMAIEKNEQAAIKWIKEQGYFEE